MRIQENLVGELVKLCWREVLLGTEVEDGGGDVLHQAGFTDDDFALLGGRWEGAAEIVDGGVQFPWAFAELDYGTVVVGGGGRCKKWGVDWRGGARGQGGGLSHGDAGGVSRGRGENERACGRIHGFIYIYMWVI